MQVGTAENTPGSPTAQISPDASSSRWVAIRSLTLPLVLLLVLRLPSLFEPHWYTDEAGYANVAYQMAHGKVLFLTTWNNKPPLLFWIYQLGFGIGGTSEFGIHLISTVTEAMGLLGTWMLARQVLSPRRVWVAMLLTAFFLAAPFLNGDLALPENLLIGLTPWSMLAVLAALRAPGNGRALLWALAAGVLFGGAVLIQQTALADLAAAMVVIVVASRRGWWLAGGTFAAAALVFAAVLTPFVMAAGLHNVFFLLVTSYNGYTTSSLHPSLVSLLPRAVAGLLLVGGAFLARSWPAKRLLPWVWLATLLLAYGLPNRDYLHFLLPAVPAACLLVARARVPQWGWWRSRSRLAVLPLLGSVAVGGFIWGSLLGAGFAQGSLFTAKLTGEYYPAFVGRLTGAVSMTDYVSLYSHAAVSEYQAVTWIRRNHLTGSTAVIWSPDSWAYLLAGLRPILPEPTIYENDTLLGTTKLLRRVESQRPVVIFLTQNSYTEYGPILPLLQRGYTEVQAPAYGELWIRSDVATRVLTAAEDKTDLKRSRH
ncbi:MAG: glycosyltransferase family 39 protein [Candidatus Dormiibacterota bacterium]